MIASSRPELFPVARIVAGFDVASWFETREDALLTMRVQEARPHPESLTEKAVSDFSRL